ncbi:MAG: hypothetical protein AAF658_07790, partial [Myxococcota bacterium]
MKSPLFFVWMVLVAVEPDAPAPSPQNDVPSETPAPGATDTAGERATPSDDPSPVVPEPVDALILRQLEALRGFGDGEAVADVAALFEVDLEDEEALRARVATLRDREETLMGSEAELDALRLRFLDAWLETLGSMNETARQALRNLGTKKTVLRKAGLQLESLEPSLLALSNALKSKISTAKSGGLLGFRTSLSEWAEQADITRQALRTTATEARQTDSELRRESGKLEASAEAFRNRFLSAALRGDRTAIDGLFLETIERQRALSMASEQSSPSSLAETVKRLVQSLREDVTRVKEIRDYDAALSALDHVDTLLTEVRQTLDESLLLPSLFEEADLRESVTVLLPLASTEARATAYPLGTELIGELLSELRTLWTDTTAYAKRRIDSLSSGTK